MTPIILMFNDTGRPMKIDPAHFKWMEQQPGFDWARLFRGERVGIEGEMPGEVWVSFPKNPTARAVIRNLSA